MNVAEMPARLKDCQMFQVNRDGSRTPLSIFTQRGLALRSVKLICAATGESPDCYQIESLHPELKLRGRTCR